MSETVITRDGRGSHGGGGGDSQKPNPIPVPPPPVTNQQLLALPPGLGETVSFNALRRINLIQLDFSIEVSKALTRAYENVRDVVLDATDRVPPQSASDGSTF